MARTYLVRGMLAGLLAGLCAFGFAKAFAEPQIAKAEAFERAHDRIAGGTAVRPEVSRDVQDTVGLGAGVAVAGVALGGIFGLAFAAAFRRFGTASAGVTAGAVGAGGFLAVFAIPFLKYPANPPAVGSPDTIGERTGAYFVLMLVGLLVAALVVLVQRQLTRRLGGVNSTLAGVVAGVLAIAFAYVVLPGYDEVPPGFPASVLWNFRVAAAGTQVVLWSVIATAFAALTARAERTR